MAQIRYYVGKSTRNWNHFHRWHHRFLRHLVPVVLQLDELHIRVRSMTEGRWFWLAIDSISKIITALHLGGCSNQDTYTLLHHLTLSLKQG